MTRLVLSPFAPLGLPPRRSAPRARSCRPRSPRPRPPSPRPNRARRRRLPSRRWSRPSAIGMSSSAKSARDASATRSPSPNRVSPRALPAIRAMRSSPTVRRKGCATKCPSSWASTSRRGQKPPTPSRARSLRSRRQIEDARRSGPDCTGRPGVVRDAPQGREPLGQERGERERADRRHAQRREIGRQGGVAQRPPVHRHLYASRVRPGDGPAAEGMPGEVRVRGAEPMDRVGLMPLGGGAGPFGFSWTAAISLGKPRFWGLVFLGFPWILSSETRLINGLHGNFAEECFVALLPLEFEAAGRKAAGETMRKRRSVHRASLA